MPFFLSFSRCESILLSDILVECVALVLALYYRMVGTAISLARP